MCFKINNTEISFFYGLHSVLDSRVAVMSDIISTSQMLQLNYSRSQYSTQSAKAKLWASLALITGRIIGTRCLM